MSSPEARGGWELIKLWSLFFFYRIGCGCGWPLALVVVLVIVALLMGKNPA